MLGILSAVVGLLVLLWMFYDLFWPPPPLVERQLGKPDQPIEYNLKHTVSLKLQTTFHKFDFLRFFNITDSSHKYEGQLPN